MMTPDQLEEIKIEYENTPIIDDRYYCLSCGNVGKEHPITEMCFICGEDNWEVVKGKESEIGI